MKLELENGSSWIIDTYIRPLVYIPISEWITFGVLAILASLWEGGDRAMIRQ